MASCDMVWSFHNFRLYTRIFLNAISVFAESQRHVSKLKFEHAVPAEHKRMATGWIFISSNAPLRKVIKFGEVEHVAN